MHEASHSGGHTRGHQSQPSTFWLHWRSSQSLQELVRRQRELAHAATVDVDPAGWRVTFRPDVESTWGQRYPHVTCHLVSSTPDAIDAVGGDELLYAHKEPRAGTHVVLTTLPTRELRLAIVGSLIVIFSFLAFISLKT